MEFYVSFKLLQRGKAQHAISCCLSSINIALEHETLSCIYMHSINIGLNLSNNEEDFNEIKTVQVFFSHFAKSFAIIKQKKRKENCGT